MRPAAFLLFFLLLVLVIRAVAVLQVESTSFVSDISPLATPGTSPRISRYLPMVLGQSARTHALEPTPTVPTLILPTLTPGGSEK